MTITGIVSGALIGGAVLVERVFALPGIGDLLAEETPTAGRLAELAGMSLRTLVTRTGPALAATALLGSPLDAAMVGGVLLLNTSISAQQSVHAERVLGELLAVPEPLARRLRV